MVLLPWDFGDEMTPYRGFMRGNSIPVTIIELVFVLLALARGFSPAASIAALPGLTKAGLGLFAITVAWTTIFIAESSATAVLGMIKLFAHLMFGLAFAQQLSIWPRQQRQRIWLVSGLGVVSYCLLWGTNIVFHHPTGDDWKWLVPTLTNIRWIGFFSLAGFCSGLGALVLFCDGRIDRRRITLSLVFCTLGCFLAVWTASRGAILAILVASLFAVFFTKDRKTLAVIILVAFVIALSLAAALPVPHEAYGLERLLGITIHSSDLNELSSSRVQIWQETVKKIAVHPWAGWGIDQFRFAGPEMTLGIRHPHQSTLQLVFATGVAGAVAITLIAIPLIRNWPRNLVSPPHWAAGSYVIAGTVYGLYDGFFYYTYPVMIFLMAVAMMLKPAEPTGAYDKSD